VREFSGSFRELGGRDETGTGNGVDARKTGRLASLVHVAAEPEASMVRNAMKKGLPGDRLRLVTGSYRRGGPLRCCTPVWISVASVSTFICSTVRARRSSLVPRRRMPTGYVA
jgi:hypothetical protein